MWPRGWVEVYLYSFITAELEGGEWSAARTGRILPPGKTRYPFYRRLDGPQDRSGRTENLVPIGIRFRTVQPEVSRYTGWATGPTHIIYIHIYIYMCVFSCGTTAILGHRPPQTQTICRTPLDEGSARRGGIYLTTHTTHTRQTSMPPAGFDYGTPESERPQTHAVDGAAIRIGTYSVYLVQNSSCTAVRSTVTAPVKIKSGIMYCRAHDSH